LAVPLNAMRVLGLNPCELFHVLFSLLSVSCHLIKLVLNYVVIGIDFAARRLLHKYIKLYIYDAPPFILCGFCGTPKSESKNSPRRAFCIFYYYACGLYLSACVRFIQSRKGKMIASDKLLTRELNFDIFIGLKKYKRLL